MLCKQDLALLTYRLTACKRSILLWLKEKQGIEKSKVALCGESRFLHGFK